MALDRGRLVGEGVQRAGRTRRCNRIIAIQAKGAFVALVLDAKVPELSGAVELVRGPQQRDVDRVDGK